MLVLIDVFTVPPTARDAFFERALESQAFVKTLPGFVEGYLHEKESGEGPNSFVTTAVWVSREAFEAARRAVADENARRGLDTHAFLGAHGIEFARGVYTRSPY